MTEQTRQAHALTARECMDALATTADGLASDEAARRLAEYGPNLLPAAPRRSGILRFLAHFHNALIYVLICAAVVTAGLGHWVDTGVIMAVVMVNAVVGFIQEGRAEEAMAAIRSMLAPHAAVLRGNARISIDAADLVPGDLVLSGGGRQGARRSAADRGQGAAHTRGDPDRRVGGGGEGNGPRGPRRDTRRSQPDGVQRHPDRGGHGTRHCGGNRRAGPRLAGSAPCWAGSRC